MQGCTVEKRSGGRIAAVLGAAAALAGCSGGAGPASRVATPARAVVASAAATRPSPPVTVPASPAPTVPAPGGEPTDVGTAATTAPGPVTPPPTVAAVAPSVPTSSTSAAPVASAAVDAPTALDGLDPVPAGWAAAAHTIAVDGLERTYLTVAPRTLTGRVPVLVLMHGVAMDAAGILDMTGLDARTGPAVIVAPEGWHRSWNAGGCCGAAFRAGIDDVSFIRATLAQVLAADPAADPARVYAVGFSNGGRMAYRLACDLPGTFSGFVAAEAVPVDGCPALHPLDIMIVAQQDDPLLSVDAEEPPKWVDGSPEPTVDATVAREKALDGCTGDPTVTYAGVAEIHRWACAAGTRLTYVWYPGGTHSWRAPSGATPGTTDLVINMIGGQQLSDRARSLS